MFKLLVIFLSFSLIAGPLTAMAQPSSRFEREYIQLMKQNPAINFQNFVEYILAKNSKVDRESAETIAFQILEQSRIYSIDPLIVISIMNVESNFKRTAHQEHENDHFHDRGLMQINTMVWIYDKKNEANLINKGLVQKGKENFIREQLYSIEINIKAGVYILDIKRDECISLENSGKLRINGFRNVEECFVRLYNGDRGRAYYNKVTASIGDFYMFMKKPAKKIEKK